MKPVKEKVHARKMSESENLLKGLVHTKKEISINVK
jgi:hypothetical protein